MAHQGCMSSGLVGALALLGVGLMAVPPSRAQDGPLPDPGVEACLLFAEGINSGIDFCSMSEIGCSPSAQDCRQLCRNGSATCRSALRSLAKANSAVAKGASKEFKLLCKTSVDRTACRQGVTLIDDGIRLLLRDFNRDVTAACNAEATLAECEAACNAGLACDCVGSVLTCS